MSQHILSNIEPRLRKLSFSDAFAYSLMVGLGETYIIAFALELGLSVELSALLGILPIAVGSVFQILLTYIARHKIIPHRWIYACGLVQALSLVLIAALGFWREQPMGDLAVILLFGLATLYWTASLAAGPVWNAWISELLLPERRSEFFIRRSVWAQAAVVVALFFSAITLQLAQSVNLGLAVLMILLILAASARMISITFISLHPKVVQSQELISEPTIAPLWKWMRKPNVISMVLFTLTTSLSVQIAAPYFSPYMLTSLNLGYASYTLLLGTAFFARILTSNWLIRINTRFGARTLLIVGSLGIVPMAYLWTLETNFYYLIILQALAGFVWSCHELGITLYLLESMAPDERSRLLSWVNLLNSLGMVGGIFIAFWIIDSRPVDSSVYFELFETTSILRLVPILILLIWSPKAIEMPRLVLRILGVRAFGQTIDRPILHKKQRLFRWIKKKDDT